MARKISKGVKSKSDKVHIKFVKRANMWCKTWFQDHAQKQSWSVDKPNPDKEEEL